MKTAPPLRDHHFHCNEGLSISSRMFFEKQAWSYSLLWVNNTENIDSALISLLFQLYLV